MPNKQATIGPNGETYRPTLKAPVQVNYEADVLALKEAMQGLGTDETGLIEILGHRSCSQRLELAKQYKASFGVDLLGKLQSELSGELCSLMKMLLMPTAKVNARALYKAMSGGGTDEDVIVEVLCGATNSEIKGIKEAYLEVLKDEGVSDPKRTLESDVEGDLSGNFKRFILALLQARREEPSEEALQHLISKGVRSIVNMEEAKADAAALYDAGAGRLGTDEATFIRILSTRSVWHLQATAHYYEQSTKKNLLQAVESETSGDFKHALQLALLASLQRPKAYAAMLHKAMDGLGTKDKSLMAIIVTRCEIDLGDIARQFEEDYGQSLETWIRDDTSGAYKSLLLALLGADWKS